MQWWKSKADEFRQLPFKFAQSFKFTRKKNEEIDKWVANFMNAQH